jgi:hypothetical protein
MPVSKEELTKDLLENPEYQTLAKETLAKKDFIIQTKDEQTSYLDRFKKDVIEKELPAKVSEIYSNIDKDIKETYGIDRETQEKTYDYLKRVGKIKISDLEKSTLKIKELEEAIAKGDTSAAMKKKLEDEEHRFKIELKKREDKIQELETKVQTTSKSADVRAIYGDLKKSFVKQLPAMFTRAETAALEEAVRMSVAEDGKLYMINSDGSIRKDSAYNKISVEDFLKAEFKDVIETKNPAGGAGSGGGKGSDPVDPKAITVENFPMKAEIKGRGALIEYMDSLGLKQGTQLYRDIYKKFSEPLTER